jgi:hypothetical protein
MQKAIAWAKTHKLVLLLSAVVLYLIFKPSFNTYRNGMYDSFYGAGEDSVGMGGVEMPMYKGGYPEEIAPQMDTTSRMVVTNSSVSLVVKDVQDSLDLIEEKAVSFKGYVVNTYVNRPEEGATGYITIRVPTSQLKPFLTFLRENAVKVVSENIDGQDITDQYVNVQERLNILNKTKTTYLAIMDKAVSVQDILQVQQQLSFLQEQIDSLEGQIKYMEASSSTSLISVNLSTDELSLPYAPDSAWRPGLIFKQAVRELVETFRTVGRAAIWIAVYSIIWIPILIIIVVVKKFINRRTTQQ